MKLSQLRRLVVEDFEEQQEWIGPLLNNINKMVEELYAALNKGLTTTDNEAGAIKTFSWDGSTIDLAWDLPRKPIGAWIVDVVDLETASKPTLANAISLVWQYTQTGGLQIIQIPGLTASSSQKYEITIKAITG